MQEKETLMKKFDWRRAGQYPKLIALGGLGIACMVIAPLLDGGDEPAKVSAVTQARTVTEEDRWERRLTEILAGIDGVGAVEVVVRMDKESVEYEKNRTVEKRTVSEGTSSTIEEKSVEEPAMQRENGAEHPIVKRTIPPRIQGVIVATDGALSSKLRGKIRQAVCAVTGVGVHRVIVLEKKQEAKIR